MPEAVPRPRRTATARTAPRTPRPRRGSAPRRTRLRRPDRESPSDVRGYGPTRLAQPRHQSTKQHLRKGEAAESEPERAERRAQLGQTSAGRPCRAGEPPPMCVRLNHPVISRCSTPWMSRIRPARASTPTPEPTQRGESLLRQARSPLCRRLTTAPLPYGSISVSPGGQGSSRPAGEICDFSCVRVSRQRPVGFR